MCVVAAVLVGDRTDPHTLHKAQTEKKLIKSIMNQEGIRGFSGRKTLIFDHFSTKSAPKLTISSQNSNFSSTENLFVLGSVVVAPEWGEGAEYIIQLVGLGGLVPNCVLMSWPEDWAKLGRSGRKYAIDFVRVIQTALSEEKSVEGK